jgi:hypothetical protein
MLTDNSPALPNKFKTQCVPITLTLYGSMLRTIKIDSKELYFEADTSNATGSPQDGAKFWDSPGADMVCFIIPRERSRGGKTYV